MISIIVAHSLNLAIGRDGQLPWKLPSDLKRFSAITRGHPTIMGRKTYESLPERFRPLPERLNIVLSSGIEVHHRLVRVCRSWEEVLSLLESGQEAFVIGGETVYRQALPFARKAYVTLVDAECEGDAFFPKLDEAEWRLASQTGPHQEKNDQYPYSLQVFERCLQVPPLTRRG